MMTTKIYRAAKGYLTQGVLLPTMQLCSKALITPNSLTEGFPLLPIIGASAAISYLAHRWMTDECSAKTIDKILNTDAGLATDYLEEGFGDEEGERSEAPIEVSVVPAPPMLTAGSPDGVAETVEGVKAKVAEEVTHTKRGVAKLDHARVEVTQHRRVRKGKQMQYMNCIMAEIKGKFGTPSHNEANRKAVQRFANSVMVRHGLRPTHIRQYLPMLVDLSFVPSEREVESMRILGSGASASTRIKYLLDCCVGGHPSQC